MEYPQANILVVAENPNTQEQIAAQILKPLGYQVLSTSDATEGIIQAVNTNPDLIIADINLSGLSGKDMLVALSAQGVEAPVIILAEEGMENEAIQAFRLGAVDYLKLPVKETEVISAVERVLKTKSPPKEDEIPAGQAQERIQYLEERIKDLTKAISLAKTLTSTQYLEDLFKIIVDGAVYLSHADRGWLMLREYDDKKMTLRYYNNLPNSFSTVINKPWDDGISSLVIEAKETLNLQGLTSQRKEISKLGNTILGVPIFDRGNILGAIILIRKESQSFEKSTQKIIETISEFVSIALVNAGLFKITKE
jgi:FixJ family two-component response regulator